MRQCGVMWKWILGLIAISAGALVVGARWRDQRRARRRYAEALRIWTEKRPAEWAAALRRLIEREEGPNGAAWYLLGCAQLWQGETQAAARAFGMAYHADWNLQTAALLTFACLKSVQEEDGELLRPIVATWEEMKSRPIEETEVDQMMLQCLEATTRDAPALSEVGRLAWLCGGPAQQEAIERLLETRADWSAPLRAEG